LLSKYYLGDQTKKNDMGRAYSRYGGQGEVVHTVFLWRNLREGDHLKNPGVDGRIILKWMFKK
jgi:hypothetical protein